MFSFEHGLKLQFIDGDNEYITYNRYPIFIMDSTLYSQGPEEIVKIAEIGREGEFMIDDKVYPILKISVELI